MIDGAHVLTPRRAALRHEGAAHLRAGGRGHPAVVRRARPAGRRAAGRATTRRVEDRLFERIDWPVDGYRLFEIGHFIGERDWFDGIVESNCLFVPRKLLEQVGGFDESFSMPGGGYANLDLFERLGPDARASRRPASSARARSTSSTAAPPPTSPTRRAAASGSSPTASTSRSCAAGRSSALDRPGPLRRRAWPPRPPGGPGRAARPTLALRRAARARPTSAAPPGARPRRAEARRHRGGVGPPGVAGGHLAGPPGQPVPDRPARLPGAARQAPARPRRAGRRRRRPRRAGRCSSRRSATSSGTGGSSPSAARTRPARPDHPRVTYVAGAPEEPGGRRRGGGAGAGAAGRAGDPRPRRHAAGGRRVRALRAAGPGRRLRGGREHRGQRPAGPAGFGAGPHEAVEAILGDTATSCPTPPASATRSRSTATAT